MLYVDIKSWKLSDDGKSRHCFLETDRTLPMAILGLIDLDFCRAVNNAVLWNQYQNLEAHEEDWRIEVKL